MLSLSILLYLTSVSIQEQIIRVGHLLPANPIIANEADVLKICANDLRKRNILPPNLSLEIITMESCKDFSGVENAAYLHYMQNATIYFGPGCNEEIVVISRLARRWNVPIIAHLSGGDALADKNLFPTLGSVALTSAVEMARATFTYLKLYNWQKIAIVRPTVDFDRLSIHSLVQMAKNSADVKINAIIEIDPMPSPNRSAAASFDVELCRGQNLNTTDLLTYVQSNIRAKRHLHQILQTVSKGVTEIFFLDAPEETGETFLIRLILATNRCKNHIALALASSAMAATLLPVEELLIPL
ncbi:unnamed protein product [Onchocerca ochengi]|uniref:ATP-dependent DNA helicase n=1 Tax=Onchocerca ochengi TaxID=42157 RepID=A0A182E9N5_ONCOC|nr:unnamed protein product [Onchocerca ochengi]